jgi:N-hydroxyarylamine O-acetyltransferase
MTFDALSTAQLDAYFARIGHDGSRALALETIAAMAVHHTRSIPFENLDILLGRGVDLDPEVVFDKLVTRGRGGYCFEQNTLMLRVLGSLGFAVTPISARVRIGRPREMMPPRTHVFVRVDLDGERWLVDVGVGALSPTAPLRWVGDTVQETPHEPRRFVFEEGRWFHQVQLGDAWSDICEFTGEEMFPIDRELGNWFTSAHPKSHFRDRLIVARAGEDGSRLTLLNRVLTRRGRDGVGHDTAITDPEHLLAVLAAEFGLRFEAGTRFACAALEW